MSTTKFIISCRFVALILPAFLAHPAFSQKPSCLTLLNGKLSYNHPGIGPKGLRFDEILKVKTELTKTLTPEEKRKAAVQKPSSLKTAPEWMAQLKEEGKLIFTGRHHFEPGNEFLVSNEVDWFNTPFDHKESDLLVAFGNNSFWEIAANQKSKHVVLADWSPYPVLAQSLVLAPLIKVSNSATDFILLLSGQNPLTHPETTLEKALEHYAPKFGLHEIKIAEVLEYLSSRPEITQTELEFLSHFFWSRKSNDRKNISPFQNLNDRRFENLTLGIHQRYFQATPSDLKKSTLHNPELFQYLKTLFTEGRIRYAVAEVMDPDFYQKVWDMYPQAQRVSLSVNNIFEMIYGGSKGAGYRYEDMQLFLRGIFHQGEFSDKKILTLFRTTNAQLPHGFDRFEIQSEIDLKQIPKTRIQQELDPVRPH